MLLTAAVVIVGLLTSNAALRRALPSESLIAFAATAVFVFLLFQTGRLG
jgi:hypothetical protein